MEAELQS